MWSLGMCRRNYFSLFSAIHIAPLVLISTVSWWYTVFGPPTEGDRREKTLYIKQNQNLNALSIHNYTYMESNMESKMCCVL